MDGPDTTNATNAKSGVIKIKLQDIGLKHKTDKATYHQYLDFYENALDKPSIKRFLEIGVWKSESLRTWREWFDKDVIVEGWDINPCPLVDGCDFRLVDQRDRNSMNKNITGLYDLILDDGAHTAETIQTSFSFLFPHTKIYIIEDLHAPWLSSEYLKPGDTNTINILDNFNKNGWTSKYALEEEKEYINKNAEIVDIFWRGERNNPLSMSAIIRNKQYK